MDVPTKQVFTASIPRPPFDWFAPRCFGRLRIAARGVSPRATLGAPLIRSDAANLIAWPSSRWWTPHGQQHEARNKERATLITRGNTIDPCHSSIRDRIRAIRDPPFVTAVVPFVTAVVPFVTHHSCHA